jgi:hypothetical protein
MIHQIIMEKVKTVLTDELITKIISSDKAVPGSISLGPLQGNPDPDQARISVTIHENDPDEILGGEPSGSSRDFADVIEEVEIGGSVTWRRWFTVKARCLLENTREDLTDARKIASTVRSRIEKALLGIDFSDVSTGTEYVSRGVFSYELRGEMYQSGGPPDAYDFHIRINFSLLTTSTL